jgi:hypothetical protein
MDCGGNQPDDDQMPGWYREPELMENFGAMERVARDRIDAVSHSPSAQVAVIVSEESTVFQRQDSALYDALIVKQLFEIGALGASVDTFRAADLRLLAEKPWFDNYRVFIFLDVLWMSEEERAAVREHVAAAGRTLVFTYGAGIITQHGLDPEAMRQVTGFPVAVRRRNEPLLVGTFVSGERRYYGSERAIGPVIYGESPDADTDVLGYLVNTDDPGLLSKDFGDWRSVWSAAPAVPAWLLRRFAKAAGVHLYLETGEQVIAERGYLTVHAAFDGSRLVALPTKSDVVDAYTGKAVARGVNELEVSLRRGETATWRILPSD